MRPRRKHRPRCVAYLRRSGRRPRRCNAIAAFTLTFDLSRTVPGEHPGRSRAAYCRDCAHVRSAWSCCVASERIPYSPEDQSDVRTRQAM